jgi:predicted Zn finger-like uncharacterized protein
MLVTTCKHCSARFRVTPEQLNLRQGQVRCGQCHEVFNGFEALERFPGDDTGARLLAARAARSPHPDPVADLEDTDFGLRLRPAAAAPAGPAPGRSPGPELPDIPALPDVPDLLLEAEEPSLPKPEPAPREAGPRAPEAAQPPAAAPEPAPVAAPLAREPSLAEFAPVRPSRAWSFGVALLLLVLAVQLAYAYRAQLAQQYPDLRPILESACAKAGCTVPFANDESALKLEDSELLEVPGRPGQIALQARIRNLSSAAQEFPHLELTLTDITGQTAVRRVMRPTDYLGRALYPGEVMAGGSEVLLSMRLETARLRPTGYELLLFYP